MTGVFIIEMIELALIQKNRDEVKAQLSKRNADYSKEIDELFHLDERRREGQKKLDDLLAEVNRISKEIGQLYRQGSKSEADKLKEKTVEIKAESQQLRDNQNEIETDIRNRLSLIPNTVHSTVQAGKGEEDNEVIHEEGKQPELGSNALPHWELAKKFNLIDFDLGAKISGSGFPVYIGLGARFQRALVSYFLDAAIKVGYREYMPPLLVNEASGFGTGQLPDKDAQMYRVEMDDLYLIPTAEVPITNIFRDVILKESDLPVKCVGYTPCFRREAGSYGKDVRGLNRLHQFDKVEIVQIRNPEESYDTLDEMVNYVQDLIRSLGLPFRVLRLCGGDLGTAAAKTIDLEVYSAAQKKWLEVSSVSNFESYQSNRLKLRFKNGAGKTALAHTLNGSALALPRIVAALLENYQNDHSITIPDVLVPYMGFKEITK